MSGERRDPLAKEKLLEGTRQRAAFFGILVIFAILLLDIRYDFEPGVYVEAIGGIIMVFLGGAAVMGGIKSHQTGRIREAEVRKAEAERRYPPEGEHYEPTPEPPPETKY